MHTALQFWPILSLVVRLVCSNRAHPRRVSMPSCNDMDYIRKMTVWKIFFVIYIILGRWYHQAGRAFARGISCTPGFLFVNSAFESLTEQAVKHNQVTELEKPRIMEKPGSEAQFGHHSWHPWVRWRKEWWSQPSSMLSWYAKPILIWKTWPHHLQLSVPFAHTNSFLYSFVPHTSSIWNSLSHESVSAPSVNVFKHTLICS